MVMNKKVTGKASSVPAGVTIGVCMSLAVMLVGAAVLAWLVASESVGEEMIGYGVMIILFAASVSGSWLSSMKIKRLRVQVSLITGGIYYLILLAITALFFGGRYHGMGVTGILVMLGSGTASILGLKGKNGRKVKTRKKVYC